MALIILTLRNSVDYDTNDCPFYAIIKTIIVVDKHIFLLWKELCQQALFDTKYLHHNKLISYITMPSNVLGNCLYTVRDTLVVMKTDSHNCELF